MSSSPKRLAFERQLQAGFVLLWPPFLILCFRESGSPSVLGLWSVRLFLVLAVYALGLLVAAAVLFLDRGVKARLTLLDQVVRVRQSRWRFGVAAALPAVGWIGLVLVLRSVGVLPSPGVIASLFDAAALVVLCEIILASAGRPPKQQQVLNKQIRLAGLSTLMTFAAVELVAATLGLGAYEAWEINPKRLDRRLRTDEFDVRVVTNVQGLREPVEIGKKRPGVYRIVVIGDSMTFGWGVEYEQTYAKVTECLLKAERDQPNLEIMNLGRPGAGLPDYLRYLRKYAARFDPDLVVFGFLIGNDCPVRPPASLADAVAAQQALKRHIRDSQDSLIERWMFRSYFVRLSKAALATSSESAVGEIGKRGPIFHEQNPLSPGILEREYAGLELPQAARERYELLRVSGWIDKGLEWRISPWLIQSAVLHPHGAADALAVRTESLATMRTEWTVCDGLLAEANQVAADLGAKLMVLGIPCPYQVSAEAVGFLQQWRCEAPAEMLTARIVNDWLVETCQRLGIPCIDPLETVRRRQAGGDSLYFPQDAHLTVAGHAILGRLLADGIANTLDGRARLPASRDRGTGSAGASPSRIGRRPE